MRQKMVILQKIKKIKKIVDNNKLIIYNNSCVTRETT